MKEKKKWLWEFSKKIVVTVTVIFVAVFVYSAVLLWRFPDSTAVISIIENASHIFEVTVVGYVIKAGMENFIKLKHHYKEDEE